MKKYIPFIFFILAFLAMLWLSACKARVAEITSDRVETSVTRVEYALPASNAIRVDVLCDTLTGLPRPFEAILDNGPAKGSIKVEGNTLSAEIRTDTVYRDSIVVKEVATAIKEVVVEKEVPKWAWWTMIGLAGCLVLFVVFPGVPKWIRRLVAGV